MFLSLLFTLVLTGCQTVYTFSTLTDAFTLQGDLKINPQETVNSTLPLVKYETWIQER